MALRLLSPPIMTKNSMRARGGFVAEVLTFVLIFGVGACNRTPAGNASGSAAAPAPSFVKLGFVTNNTSEFWKIAGAGIHKYEKEAKVQVDLKLPASGTAESQNQILQDLASQG